MSLLGKIGMGLAGLFLIITGIAAIAAPGETFMAMSWLWAIFTIVGAVLLLIIFFKSKDVPGRGMILFFAIVEGIIGIMLVANGSVFTAMVALNLLQILVIFAGISGIVGCFELKRAGVGTWWLDLVLGIILLLIGLSSASSAVFNVSMTAAAVGLGLIVTGIGFITKIFQK